MITSKDINFDSYMLLEADLPKGALRLLEVDNRLVLPIRTSICLNITATVLTAPNTGSNTAAELLADKYRAGHTNLQFGPLTGRCDIVRVTGIPRIHPFADLDLGIGYPRERIEYDVYTRKWLQILKFYGLSDGPHEKLVTHGRVVHFGPHKYSPAKS